MKAKHSVWNKLLATGGALGALALGVGPAHAVGPMTVTLGPLDQAPGLSTNAADTKRVGFTVHSYVVFGASDITSVNPVLGTSYVNEAVPVCAPGIGATVTQPGTNLVDGDIWYVGCLGVYDGIEVTVTVNP